MSPHLSESMDQILDRFDDAWNGPTPPRIEDYLALADGNSDQRLAFLIELLKIDMERRFQRGEQPALDEYRRRFPDCSEEELAAGLEEARAAAQRVAALDKETDDPRVSPTLEGPPLPPITESPLQLVGEYELLQRLGSGGMGEVYKARHRRLDKLVALKLLSTDPQHSREAAARFQREMKAVGALDHPNVVEAHDAGEQSGVIYLAMKLIDGVDLERLVKERGPLPIAEACGLVRQAALGLDYLHQRGLVHRDVKPSNLMRTADGTVKVLDLGLARWHMEAEAGQALTTLGRTMGTPDFLAPEQIENAAHADARSDLYGLGGTLFYLLTGRPPFADHKSLYSKLDAHRHEPPPDLRSLRPEAPAALADLVNRLLAKKPEERPQTAAAVAQMLAPFLDESLPTGGRPLSGSRVAWRASARHWRWYAAAAAGLTLLGCLGWFLHGSPKPTPSSPSTVLSRGPVRVLMLDAKLTRNVNGGGLPAGRIGVEVFDPHLGDTVTLDAQLSRPAYAFLIAFRPDGEAEVCFPERDDEPPPLTDQLRYPPRGREVEYGLNDGVGLEAFAVVVSSRPLLSFKEWWPQGQGCPWKKEDAPLSIVYRGNGEDPVQAWSAAGEARGKGVEVPGKTPLAKLAAWLRTIPQIETVQVLGFAVAAKAQR